jgi:hypothetical protein
MARSQKSDSASSAGLRIQIDKGIPIPTSRDTTSVSSCHPRPKWTELLRKMVRGDSIVVPIDIVAAVLASAHRINVGTLRRQGPNEALRIPQGQARIWRTT